MFGVAPGDDQSVLTRKIASLTLVASRFMSRARNCCVSEEIEATGLTEKMRCGTLATRNLPPKVSDLWLCVVVHSSTLCCRM